MQLSVLREHSAEHIITKTEPEVEIEDAEESKVELPEPETSELTNELTTEENENEDLVPAVEIKMSFSPTKLNECFVQQNDKKQSGAFELKQQEINEQFGA